MGDTFDRALATEEIRRILMAYPEAVDRGDIKAVGRYYDGVKMGNSVGRNAPAPPDDALQARTAAEVEELYRGVRLYDDGLPHTKHLITNIDLTFGPGGTTATSTCYYTVLQARPDFPLQIVIAGRYVDTFVAEGGRWRMVTRREYADLIGDLSHHLDAETMKLLDH